VIIKKIAVPSMKPEELANQIKFEAEHHIPFAKDDVEIDYHVVNPQNSSGQTELLLVAAKRETVADYVQVVRDASLTPHVVDVASFASQNGFEVNYNLDPRETAVIITVGAAISNINIVSRGVSAFTREITNAGNSVTEEIQKQLGVPFDQAELYKLGSAQPHTVPPQVHAAIGQACETLAGEIQRSLDFYLATSGEAEIHRVVVCGGSVFLPSLVPAIEKRARVPVMVLDAMANFSVERGVNEQDLRARAPQLAVAVGLALRTDKETRTAETKRVRVNLLAQRKDAKKGAATGEGSQTWLLAVVGAILLELLVLFFIHKSKTDRLTDLQGVNNGIQADIDKIKRDTADHKTIKDQLQELRDREEAVNKLQTARTGPTSSLLELSKIMTPGRGPTVDRDKIEQLKHDNPSAVPNPNWDPRRLWITKYSEVDRNVKIEGLARDGEDVAELLRRLSLSEYFYDIKPLPATEVADKDTKINLKQFVISAKVKY